MKSCTHSLVDFFQPLDRCSSERKTILIPTKYANTVANMAVLEMIDEEETEKTLPPYVSTDDSFLSLVHVALKICQELIETPVP